MKDDTTENKYISSVLDLFSIPNFYIRKGRPHGHTVREGTRMQRVPHGKSASKEVSQKKKNNMTKPTDRFIRDKLFRKTMIELGRSDRNHP